MPVYILGWWTDTDSFINGNICIMGWITDIPNPGSDYMHICNRNVYSEWVSMCHWTELLITINTLNIITPTSTVTWNKFPWIITVTFLNTWSDDWIEDLFSIREVFCWYGIWNRTGIFSFSYCTNKYYLHYYLWGPFRDSQILSGVRGFSERD